MAQVIIVIDKDKIIKNNVKKADNALYMVKSEIAKDTEKHVPFRHGGLRRSVDSSVRSKNKKLVYSKPYAAFQYHGKVMIGTKSGKVWSNRGETKRVTNKALSYSQPGTGKEWWKVSKSLNMDKWVKFIKKVFKNAK